MFTRKRAVSPPPPPTTTPLTEAADEKKSHLGVAEAVNPVCGPVPLSEEATGLLFRPYPALVISLHGLEGLLNRLLEAVVPQLVNVLLQEVVDLVVCFGEEVRRRRSTTGAPSPSERGLMPVFTHVRFVRTLPYAEDLL